MTLAISIWKYSKIIQHLNLVIIYFVVWFSVYFDALTYWIRIAITIGTIVVVQFVGLFRE